MEEALKNKIEHFATLLAGSPVEDHYKEIISDLIGDMTEADLDKFIAIFEQEETDFLELAAAIKNVDAEQDLILGQLKQKQEDKAREMEDGFKADILRQQINQQ